MVISGADYDPDQVKNVPTVSWKDVRIEDGLYTLCLVGELNLGFLTLSLLSAPFLRKENEPFLFENASNLTHDFLYDNINKKI